MNKSVLNVFAESAAHRKFANNLLKISSAFLVIMMIIDATSSYILIARGFVDANPIVNFLYMRGLLFVYPTAAVIILACFINCVNSMHSISMKIKYALFAFLFLMCSIALIMQINNFILISR
jgi:hypothetical protein